MIRCSPSVGQEQAQPCFEKHNMYVVRLMRDCNNHCEFCMVKDEILQARLKPPKSFEELTAEIIQNEPPGGWIDFFGGEPTLYPHLVEVIQFAREKKYTCSIATNGRRFSDLKFTQKLAALRVAEIRSTLLGHTPALHNFLSGSAATSYHQTIQGFQNIIQCDIPLQVNIVILKQNHQYLTQITDLLIGLGVNNIKYSVLIRAGICPSFAVRHSLVRNHLYQAISRAERAKIQTISIEKAPICLFPRYQQYFISETDTAADCKMPKHLTSCHNCALSDQCFGPDSGYLDLFGSQEFRPVEQELV
jgi:MoaA/NifB/PqqE/SkfB family radical SAM enzyme